MRWMMAALEEAQRIEHARATHDRDTVQQAEDLSRASLMTFRDALDVVVVEESRRLVRLAAQQLPRVRRATIKRMSPNPYLLPWELERGGRSSCLLPVRGPVDLQRRAEAGPRAT